MAEAHFIQRVMRESVPPYHQKPTRHTVQHRVRIDAPL